MDSFNELDDLQCAILSSFIANEHCLLTFEGSKCEALEDGITSFVRDGFGFQIMFVDMTEHQTLDDFASQIILEGRRPASPRSPEEGYFSRRMESSLHLAVPQLPNVIVLKHLESANVQLQAQILDIMTSRKLVTRKAVIPAPKRFLLIPLLFNKMRLMKPNLITPLVDSIFISHDCTAEHLEDDFSLHDTDSLSSVIIRRPTPNRLTSSFSTPGNQKIRFSDEALERLTEASRNIFIHVDVKKYMADIITFLRLHRAVSGGVSPRATKHFELLVRCTATLSLIEYVTPTIVTLATPKIYNHRIEIVGTEDERSLQWGSTEAAVNEVLAIMDAQMVIDEVLDADGGGLRPPI